MRAGTLATERLYYHRNQQYSVTALTDTTGAISERYAYDAYGELTVLAGGGTVLSGSAYDNRYTFTGREWDEELGLYHYRARMYDPVAGGFVSRDPIGYIDGAGLYTPYFLPEGLDPYDYFQIAVENPYLPQPYLPDFIDPYGDLEAGLSKCSAYATQYPCSSTRFSEGNCDDRLIDGVIPAKGCKCSNSKDGAVIQQSECQSQLEAAKGNVNLGVANVVLGNVYCSQRCGGSNYGLTCWRPIQRGPSAGKLEIGVCIPIANQSGCNAEALTADELTHVTYLVMSVTTNPGTANGDMMGLFDRDKFEDKAYRAQCDIEPSNRCLKDGERVAYVEGCVLRRKPQSTLGANVTSIRNACDRFQW
ncbi:RHS repeat domain-containing protein [Roseimaritima multifibrata]|nr:RHS repeat-associated core domain-containing protein [Roseimaritima multifibrata]